MSDVETWGFPRVALGGSSTDRDPGATYRAKGDVCSPVARSGLGAWDCLGLALSKDLPPVTTITRPVETLKWARHTVDAVRVILGLDTLYAAEKR